MTRDPLEGCDAPAPRGRTEGPTDALAAMGDRLRERRLAADVCQTELAAAAGVSPSLVYNVERGVKPTRRSTLELLVDTLGRFGEVDGLLDELLDLVGGELAAESERPGHLERVAARRARDADLQRAQLDRALRRAREAGNDRLVHTLATTPLRDLATLLAVLGIEPDPEVDAVHVRFPEADGEEGGS